VEDDFEVVELTGRQRHDEPVRLIVCRVELDGVLRAEP
jgi:hypothetical protein